MFFTVCSVVKSINCFGPTDMLTIQDADNSIRRHSSNETPVNYLFLRDIVLQTKNFLVEAQLVRQTLLSNVTVFILTIEGQSHKFCRRTAR